MSLEINLYHEVLLTKKQELYDPLKLSILILIVVTIGLASYYFVALAKKISVTSTQRARQTEVKQLEPLAKEAKLKEEELNIQIGLAGRLEKRIEGRFYWAPVLAQIIESVPKNVQITKLGTDLNQEKSGSYRISIDGRAAGIEPRAVAEELRTSIVAKFEKNYRNVTAIFKTLEDSKEMTALDGKQARTAFFAISVMFASGEEKRPAPLPIAKPRKRLGE